MYPSLFITNQFNFHFCLRNERTNGLTDGRIPMQYAVVNICVTLVDTETDIQINNLLIGYTISSAR